MAERIIGPMMVRREDHVVRELMIRLDMALTGKQRRDAEHTAEGQPFNPLDGRIYYLSDGGYSRICLDDSDWPQCRLFVASESLDHVKTAWLRPEVKSIVAEIEADLQRQYE